MHLRERHGTGTSLKPQKSDVRTLASIGGATSAHKPKQQYAYNLK
jgi:hypothetical protein